jgi:predicted RNA-binding Zn ribbon-like protein
VPETREAEVVVGDEGATASSCAPATGLRSGLASHCAPVDLVGAVAGAASDLLCHADFSLVRKCENPAGLRYFYDVGKNHARRWCSMSVCGNRMKVALYHRRAQLRRRA